MGNPGKQCANKKKMTWDLHDIDGTVAKESRGSLKNMNRAQAHDAHVTHWRDVMGQAQSAKRGQHAQRGGKRQEANGGGGSSGGGGGSGGGSSSSGGGGSSSSSGGGDGAATSGTSIQAIRPGVVDASAQTIVTWTGTEFPLFDVSITEHSGGGGGGAGSGGGDDDDDKNTGPNEPANGGSSIATNVPAPPAVDDAAEMHSGGGGDAGGSGDEAGHVNGGGSSPDSTSSAVSMRETLKVVSFAELLWNESRWYRVQVTCLEESAGSETLIEFQFWNNRRKRKTGLASSYATPFMVLDQLLDNEHLALPGTHLEWPVVESI